MSGGFAGGCLEQPGSFREQSRSVDSGAVAGVYEEACQIVVRADSEISTVEELEGHRVSIGEEESGTKQNALQILAAYGLNEKLVEEVS